MLEQARVHTGRPSLYSLFSLPEDSAVEQVTKTFHKLSRTLHPDKNKDSADIHSLLTAAHTVLKSEKSRKRLKWLLEEAPPWHRSTVYTVRKYIKKPNDMLKLSVSTVLLGCLILSLVVDLGVLWIKWLMACYSVYASRQELKKLGRKEMKRMERKLAETGPSRAMANSPVQQLIVAQSNYPRPPTIFSSWPCMLLKRSLQKWKQD